MERCLLQLPWFIFWALLPRRKQKGRMRDGCHIFGNGKSSKTTKKNQHHKFPSGLGYPKPEGKDEGESYTLFRTSPPSSVPPPTAMAHPVPIAPCRSPFAASRPAPSYAPRSRATPRRPPLPTPHPRLVSAGGVVAFGATKPRDF